MCREVDEDTILDLKTGLHDLKLLRTPLHPLFQTLNERREPLFAEDGPSDVAADELNEDAVDCTLNADESQAVNKGKDDFLNLSTSWASLLRFGNQDMLRKVCHNALSACMAQAAAGDIVNIQMGVNRIFGEGRVIVCNVLEPNNRILLQRMHMKPIRLPKEVNEKTCSLDVDGLEKVSLVTSMLDAITSEVSAVWGCRHIGSFHKLHIIRDGKSRKCDHSAAPVTVHGKGTAFDNGKILICCDRPESYKMPYSCHTPLTRDGMGLFVWCDKGKREGPSPKKNVVRIPSIWLRHTVEG